MSSQPTKMANQQESNRGTEQPFLGLNSATRLELITSLIRLTDILQDSEPIKKESTRKIIENTILLLFNLTPFKPTRPALKLPRTDRSSLINHLVDMKDTVLSDSKAIVDVKRRLITENERVVIQLMKLSNPEASDLASGARSENGEPASKRQRVDCETNEKVGQLKDPITGLVSNVDRLKDELSVQIKSMEIIRPEATVQFELTGVSKFLETTGSKHVSDRFWCRGLLWSLYVQCNQIGARKSLGFYLQNENGDPKRWTCKVDIKMILINKLPDKPNLTRLISRNTERKASRGCPSFVSYDKLTDESNGYIQDDKILLRAELKVGPVNRTDGILLVNQVQDV